MKLGLKCIKHHNLIFFLWLFFIAYRVSICSADSWWSFCLSLHSTGTTGMRHHVRLRASTVHPGPLSQHGVGYWGLKSILAFSRKGLEHQAISPAQTTQFKQAELRTNKIDKSWARITKGKDTHWCIRSEKRSKDIAWHNSACLARRSWV